MHPKTWTHMCPPNYHWNMPHLMNSLILLIRFCFSMKNISFFLLLIFFCLRVIQQ
jgi:hypothetical protein